MELEVYNIQGEKTGRKVELSPEIYGIEPNDHVIYLDVKRYMAHKRQGTHSTKERSQVKGSTRKIKRQKGTGTARAGDIKSPIFRGGGTIFGPRPHAYRLKVNRKTKQLARKSALTYKMKNDRIRIVEDFSMEKPQTKRCAEILKALDVKTKNTLMVVHQSDKNLWLSIRNIPGTGMARAQELSTYDVMKAQQLVFTESSVKAIDNLFSNKTKTQ